MDDLALLRKYADSGSEDAFRELVGRHLPTVYSAARRQVGEPLAADVTQAVFILLARKAGKLRANTILTAWLLTTTRLVSSSTRRSEFRRQRREQEAVQMPRRDDSTDIQSAWEQVQPALDDALAALPANDRDLVALRFFEKKSHAEIAAKMGVSEDTSKKRLSRAVERLRTFFARGGISLPVALLLAAISENAIQAAPAGLAPKVITAVSGAGGGAVAGLVHATLHAIHWSRIKFAAAGVGTLAIVSIPVLFLWLSPGPGVVKAIEEPLAAAAPADQAPTGIVREIELPPSLDPSVVRGPDGRLAKLERYEFQATAVQYSYPPSAATPTRAVVSPVFPREPLLSAEFSWQVGPNFPRAEGLCVATADELGNEFDPVATDMSVDAGQDRQYWVSGLPVFPRRGKEVRLRVLSSRSLLAEFKIPNPAPGPHPTWNAEPLPVRAVDRELDVSLVQFRTYPVSRETEREKHVFSRTECLFRVREDDHDTTAWRPATIDVSDATGNHWSVGGGARNSNRVGVEDGLVRTEFTGALWSEPAWKLRVQFKRTSGFTDGERLEISHIRIPDAKEVSELHTPYEWNGATLELAGVSGTDVANLEPGGGNNSKILVNAELKRGCITVILTGKVVSRNRQLSFVSATDDQGRPVELAAFDGPTEAKYEKFPVPFSCILNPPKGARELNLVVAITEARFLEFIARPEQVGE